MEFPIDVPVPESVVPQSYDPAVLSTNGGGCPRAKDFGHGHGHGHGS